MKLPHSFLFECLRKPGKESFLSWLTRKMDIRTIRETNKIII